MRKYCKAYHLQDVRKFQEWDSQQISAEAALSDESVVYLWDDYTVTTSPIHQDTLLFTQVTPQWREFCSQTLHFTIPEDLLYAYAQQRENNANGL